jgi:phosphoglycolate phosphatase
MPAVPLATAKALLDHLDPSILFSDLDGTLLGRHGSLFSGFDGSPTLEAAQALIAAHQAGLRIMLMSGRTKANVLTVARLLGITDLIAELGTVLVIGGETELLWGNVPLDVAPTPAQAMQATGMLDWLLERYRGRLEPHEPLPQERLGTVLLRGQLELAEANSALTDAGFGWAHLADNGRFNRPFVHLGTGRTHAYHLTPSGVNKATAARVYLKRRGLLQNQAAAIGDAPSDLALASEVGAMFLVANGAWAAGEVEKWPVIVTQGSAGRGWAEAVNTLLACRTRRN